VTCVSSEVARVHDGATSAASNRVSAARTDTFSVVPCGTVAVHDSVVQLVPLVPVSITGPSSAPSLALGWNSRT